MVFGQCHLAVFRPLFNCLLSLFISSVAISKEEEVPLSVDGLVMQALARNPELRYYKAEIAAAKADRKSAGKLPNPELNLDVGRKTVRGGESI